MKQLRTVFGSLIPATDAQARRVAWLKRKFGAAEVNVTYDGKVNIFGREYMRVGRNTRRREKVQ